MERKLKNDKPLAGRTLVLGLSGSIAAYKACELANQLVKLGAEVWPVMTDAAAELVGPLSLETLTGHPVARTMFGPGRRRALEHIDLADAAEVVVVAPATANVIGKVANGIADDLLSTVIMATKAKVLFAPAMNVHMWLNPIVQENVERLKSKGCLFVEPGEGPLACGYEGKGRMAEPGEILKLLLKLLLIKRDLEGKVILITAGRTEEPLDPVRFLSNRSSGRMGYALARAAHERGARVILVTGPASVSPPGGVEICQVQTAEEMKQKVLSRFPKANALLMVAAVADFRPRQSAREKIKKEGAGLTLALERTPDILSLVAKKRKVGQRIVGFALETQNGLANARRKLGEKKLDLVVLNSPAAFGSETNKVTLIDRKGNEPLSEMSKGLVAERIMDRLARMLAG
jgi:phosphopantothenoylcysteine decarboxylase / phosphopantothenate---cysteine ligase